MRKVWFEKTVFGFAFSHDRIEKRFGQVTKYIISCQKKGEGLMPLP